ncbi:MAG: hypothetical protein BRC29_01795 [Nanohaloarchaea archaeon SW_7_43_1]|nr:MAG: hypothetical protein BRC29_01795 [Nanohaloarchaea archaeon SW_7_43_1]
MNEIKLEAANEDFYDILGKIDSESQEYQRKRRAVLENTTDYIINEIGKEKETLEEDTLTDIYQKVDDLISYNESVIEEKDEGIPWEDAMIAATTDHPFEVKL